MNLALALQKKVEKFCKTLSHEDLQQLAIYLGTGIVNGSRPTKVQQTFCESFIGAVSYGDYLKFHSLPEEKRPYFSTAYKTSADVSELYNFVSWQCCLRMSNLFCEIADKKVESSKLELEIANKKLETAKLKEDLANAILHSYEGNVFYKDEGWLNISEVLEKYKLIDLEG